MTILFLTRLFYPHIGGVEKHVMELSKQLIKKGHKIIVVTENHEWKEQETVNGIEILRINAGKNEKQKKFFIWKELWKLRKHIENADVVHCHDVFFWYLPFKLLFPSKAVYVTFHGYEGNTIPGMKAVFMHKLAETFSSGNICIGDFLTKWYHTKATIVSYGATTIPPKVENKKPGKTLQFLYVGRLEEEAGILEYIKSLDMLKQNGIESRLTVLGDGSQRKEAERLGKSKNLHITFKGFVSDVSSYFSDADYVFVSRYLGILEAFAHRRYVFAVSNSAIKNDYLSMTPFVSWITLAKTSKELTEYITDIIKNEKQKNTNIEHASTWVKQQTWENLSKQYLLLWEKK